MSKIDISIIIPCRNEENYIRDCLLSVINNDYPNNKLEIIVVDGISEDKTINIVKELAKQHLEIKLITNPHKTAPQAFNLGINASSGEYILIIGAHAEYPKDYISKLLKHHKTLDADNIGGVLITDVKNHNKKSDSIIAVLSNKFGVGDASFRTGTKEIISVDTVAYGCYKRQVFEDFGLFNEKLIRNQDIEYNKRLIKANRKIYLVPDVECKYFARETFRSISKNNFQNGLWNILTVYYTKNFESLSIRHFIPLIFVLSIALPLLLSTLWWPFAIISGISALLYSFLILIISIINRTNKTSIIYIIWSFIVLHFSYGFGSLVGIIKLPYIALTNK